MALFFALGSTCFLIGPLPGYAQLVGASADAITFFIGSILFTTGGALQTWIAFPERHSFPRNWLSTSVPRRAVGQFGGRLDPEARHPHRSPETSRWPLRRS